MYSVGVDLADDRFDVTFDATQVSVDDLLRSIRDLDYEPEVATAPKEEVVVAERIDLELLPQELQALLAKARTQRKPVLVEFSGPG